MPLSSLGNLFLVLLLTVEAILISDLVQVVELVESSVLGSLFLDGLVLLVCGGPERLPLRGILPHVSFLGLELQLGGVCVASPRVEEGVVVEGLIGLGII